MRRVLVDLVLTTPLVGAYMMFALGIVFVYRGSKVLNLAHGAMAMLPAYLAYALAPHIGRGGFVPALAAGAAIGACVERFVVRRLRASPTAQTVGTVAVLGLLVAVAARVWGTTPLRAPHVFASGAFGVGDARLQWDALGLLCAAIAAAAGCAALLARTDLGLALRGAAENRRAAALMGVDPDRAAAVAWAGAGILAAAGGILLAASTNLHPYTLSLQVLPAFVAALIGGLESVPGAVWGSAVVGTAIGIVPSLSGGARPGVPQVVLALAAFVVMALRGERYVGTGMRSLT
jgi:branched-chain amino acid transport system permease protein